MISNYNIFDAIHSKQNIIVPPKIVSINACGIMKSKYMKHPNNKVYIRQINFYSVMKILNKYSDDLPYRKIIAWCGTIDLCNIWKDLFDKHKMDKNNNDMYKYGYLKRIKTFINHTKVDNNNCNDYEIFKNIKCDAILFCADKHREGSNIKYLDTCIFPDNFKEISILTFIQFIV